MNLPPQRPVDPTGGPAFPFGEPTGCEPTYGMRLRDYFAAKAMQSFLDNVDKWGMGYEGAELRPAIAKLSYAIADTMLAERAKEQA